MIPMLDNATELRIRLIEDELAIKHLIDEYGRRADTLDWEYWTETFTEDSMFDFDGSFGVMQGRDNIRETCRGNMAPVYEDFMHYMLNTIVSVDGSDIATGTGNIVFVGLPDKSRPDEFFAMGGRYKWEFRREHDGWKISRTHVTFLWNTNADINEVFAKPVDEDA